MSAKLPVLSDLLTASRLKTARSCARLHHLRYDLGYRPIEDAEALRFGTLVHLGLEAWWRASADARLSAALEAIRNSKSDPFEQAKAKVMLVGYSARWGAEPYEVIAVEAPFETDLRNPESGMSSRTWRLAGKIDAIVRDQRDGQVRIIEHKTSSSDTTQGSAYFQQLRLDSQISIYFEGAAALGYTPISCVYDVLGKPQLKPLKATPVESRKYKKDGTLYAAQRDRDETVDEYEARLVEAIASDPDRYFQRVEVVRLESELREHQYDLWQQAKLIRESQRAGVAPKNSDACFRYGRPCSFFGVCCGVQQLDDRQRFDVSTEVHPELTELA